MTDNKRIILEFIDSSLEWGDNRRIAEELKVDEKLVSRVRKGKDSSARILAALEELAMRHRTHAMKIEEFLNKK